MVGIAKPPVSQQARMQSLGSSVAQSQVGYRIVTALCEEWQAADADTIASAVQSLHSMMQ